MSEPSPSLTRTSSARPRPANIVKHPAWCEARNRILAAASAGPATLALVGAAGTGKTWLLRELATDLRERGYEVTLLPQGDLPWRLKEGAALLVDEAYRMDEPALSELAAQRSGLVILADLPIFAETLERLSPPPATIGLSPLNPEQLRRFVVEWIERANERGVTITDEAVQRLVVHSSGTPRLIAQFLNAALALAGLSDQRRIGGADIDQVAELRLGGLGSEPLEAAEADFVARSLGAAAEAAASPPTDTTPAHAETEQAGIGEPAIVPRRSKPARKRRAALALSALAASIVFGWLLQAPRQPVTVEKAVVPSPSIAGSAAALALADTVANIPPASLTASPEQALVPSAPLATVPPPVLDTARAAPVIQSAPSPSMAVRSEGPVLMALAQPPSPLPLAGPKTAREKGQLPDEATLPPPARADSMAVPTYRAGRGGPGLILIARRGDTLEALYADIYQGLRPPSYDEVVAANPRPFRPGAMVVFPAPPGGWTRH